MLRTTRFNPIRARKAGEAKPLARATCFSIKARRSYD